MPCSSVIFFFFFQAEDGIRDVAVTGVQTCALPVCFGVKVKQPAQWITRGSSLIVGAKQIQRVRATFDGIQEIIGEDLPFRAESGQVGNPVEISVPEREGHIESEPATPRAVRQLRMNFLAVPSTHLTGNQVERRATEPEAIAVVAGEQLVAAVAR